MGLRGICLWKAVGASLFTSKTRSRTWSQKADRPRERWREQGTRNLLAVERIFIYIGYIVYGHLHGQDASKLKSIRSENSSKNSNPRQTRLPHRAESGLVPGRCLPIQLNGSALFHEQLASSQFPPCPEHFHRSLPTRPEPRGLNPPCRGLVPISYGTRSGCGESVHRAVIPGLFFQICLPTKSSGSSFGVRSVNGGGR